MGRWRLKCDIGVSELCLEVLPIVRDNFELVLLHYLGSAQEHNKHIERLSYMMLSWTLSSSYVNCILEKFKFNTLDHQKKKKLENT